MPEYIFYNKKTDEYRSVIQKMNEEHIFVDEKGFQWERVWSIPQAAVNTQINPFSSKDFAAKTESKKDSLGSLWERSKEASEKRKDKLGVKVDPQRQKWYDNWSKQRGGTKKLPKRYLYE